MEREQKDRVKYFEWAVKFILTFVVVCFIVCMFTGCKTQYVPVEQFHNEHHYHTDSVFQRDSIIRDTKTTIMQLDSAEMAKYGIRLKSAERAWLVQTQELERRLAELAHFREDSIHRVDSIPYPVEVIKEVKHTPAIYHYAMALAIIFIILIIKRIIQWLPFKKL